MIKVCRKCERERPHSIRSSGKPMTWCQECQRDYSKQHYQKNKIKHIERHKINSKERAVLLRKYIDSQKGRPCVDCKSSHPACVMDFDHIEGVKVANISDTVRLGWSIERIQEEIDKCELVCANCHRKRTHSRL